MPAVQLRRKSGGRKAAPQYGRSGQPAGKIHSNRW